MNENTKKQLSFLAEKLGLDILLDDNQQALLLIDGQHPVSIRLFDSGWRFYSMICYASDVANSNGNYKKMLSINMNELKHGGGGLCLDESENIILYILNPSHTDHTEGLYNNLNIFVNRSDAIREMLI